MNFLMPMPITNSREKVAATRARRRRGIEGTEIMMEMPATGLLGLQCSHVNYAREM
jgi:hypothetical protein